MRIVVLGGGPAGLYFSLLMKKADPRHDITVIERNPPDATYGWGVVFSEETLGAFRDADRETFDDITDTFAKWNAIEIRYGGETIRSRGHAFSAIARKRLLLILQRRCAELGVELRFRTDVTDPGPLQSADLVVGADGVNSLLRRTRPDAFRTGLHVHRTRFAWFGTDFAFKAFTFIFRESEHGLFQVHGYPYDAHGSTFIVECHEETWLRAGLDQAIEEESMAFCEKLFVEDLAGHSLFSNRSLWVNFVTVRNETWHDGNMVLLGDAAHTAHFTIGSGTKLAMEDAIALADALGRHENLESALTDYEMARQPVVERFQTAASESAAYFENVRRYAGFRPIQFAFNLLTRSGRITHLELEKRDPAFVATVDGWFAQHALDGAPAGRTPVVSRPPYLSSLRVAEDTVTNRVALSPVGDEGSIEGVVGDDLVTQIVEAAALGAGAVLTDLTAVTPEGRVTSGTPGLYAPEHAAAWNRLVTAAHAAGPEVKVIVRLGHAGRRGSTRPRREGVDRPLRSGNWPLLAPSPVAYARWSRRPRALDRAGLVRIRDAFAAIAAMAALAGIDGLEVDMGYGYLLGSFLSPLSNRRSDSFGGTLENRMRFPLEVFDAVRTAWPAVRPLGTRLTATDWARGGLEPDDAVQIAAALRDRGCDFIEVVGGQTVPDDRPEYGRLYLVPLSDRIRNEGDISTLVSGNITTLDEINTILAAGRADLCILDVPD